MRKGQSHRFNARRNGPFHVVRVFDNNTVELGGVKRGSAVVNIERCHLLKERPDYWHFNPDADKHVESNTDMAFEEDIDNAIEKDEAPLISSADMNTEEHAEMVEDQQILALTPLRRSTRVRRQPDRLTYSSMSMVTFDGDFAHIFDAPVGGHDIDIASEQDADIAVTSRTMLEEAE